MEKSHLTRGAWIEIQKIKSAMYKDLKSHLTRGAWIEIEKIGEGISGAAVAPHTRCVD